MANKDIWRGWKLTAEQCDAIRNGDITARNRCYFDNLERIQRMARTYSCKHHFCDLFYDLVNGVYIDFDYFYLSKSKPVVDGLTMSYFVILSFRYALYGGYSYVCKYNSKLLSSDYKFNCFSLDSPNDDGVTLGDFLTDYSADIVSPDYTEFYISEVSNMLKRYPRMLEYFKLYMLGYSNALIADIMGISLANVSHYFDRLGKRLYALKSDILPLIEFYGGIDCTRYYDVERKTRTQNARIAPKTDEMPDDVYLSVFGASALWKRKNKEKKRYC